MIFTPIILNDGPGGNGSKSNSLDMDLTLALADLKGKFINSEKGVIEYQAIRKSKEYRTYKELTRGLKSFDLEHITDRRRKISFWINIYNAAVIHGVIELGLSHSVKEIFKFFDRVSYEIGGFLFSLNDMEHGILRGNQSPPYRLFKPFGKKDRRKDFAVLPMDPRIHFALVCGATSCPPISFYEADQIDFQLQLAAESFINSPKVQILPGEKLLLLSMIFKWYKKDFGGSDQALVDTVLRFLDEGEKKNFLKDHRDQIRMKYQPYDWSLNQA